MSNFKVGQKVICIESHPYGFIKKGLIYIISSLYKCKCGDTHIGVKNINHPGYTVCPKGGYIDMACFYSKRFAPIIEDKSAIKELIKNFKEVEERIDIEQPIEV